MRTGINLSHITKTMNSDKARHGLGGRVLSPSKTEVSPPKKMSKTNLAVAAPVTEKQLCGGYLDQKHTVSL